jgi:hypothetical protein
LPPGWLRLRTGSRGTVSVGITASGHHPVVLAPVCGFLLAGIEANYATGVAEA